MIIFYMSLPINGLDEVIGIISETVFRKIVRESRIVTPEKEREHSFIILN